MEFRCCVLGCTRSRDEEIKLHRFPFNDKLLLPIWIMATNRSYWTPNDSSRMCDKHFNIDDYESGNKNNRLKPNACPIIAPSTSTSDVMKAQVYSNTLRGDDSASDINFSDANLSDCDTPNTSDLIISDDSSLFSDSSMDVCSILGDSNDVEHSEVEKKIQKTELEEDSISISSHVTNYDDTDRIPVQKCAVTLCNQKARNQFDKLFYINFPVENKTLSDCWWNLCGQQTDFDPTAKICSIHFDAADFINRTIQKDGQIYRQTSLKNHSVVPSLYLSAEEYFRFSNKQKKKADNKSNEPIVKKISIENYKCSIKDCIKTSSNENTMFFQFPLYNQLKLETWVNNLKMPGWKPLNTDRICSDHFESDQIIKKHNGYKLTLNAKPVFKPKKPFIMPTNKNTNNTTNKKKLNTNKKKVIKQPSIKVTYKRVTPDCIMVNEVDFTPDKCNINSSECPSSAQTVALAPNETLKENVIDLLEDRDGEGDPKKPYVNDIVQSFLNSFANSLLPSDMEKSPLECNEKTLEQVGIDSFENHKDNLDADVESLIKAAIETESNITQEVSENEDLPSNNAIGLEHLLSNTPNDKNIELLDSLSMTSLENQLLETHFFQDEDKDKTGSENKNNLEYIYVDTPLEFIQECNVETTENDETQELVPEKCIEEISDNDETQELLIPEICTTEDKEELSSRSKNYLEYIYTDTPLEFIQECVVNNTVNNETQELVSKKCMEGITANDETQVLMLEKCALEDTEKTEYSNSNNQFQYIHTDAPLEFIEECVVETSINDDTEVSVAEKCIIQDKAEVELVYNESNLKDIHTDTPLNCLQECEVESTVNNETPLQLPEKYTTTENIENQMTVFEKCTTGTTINSETQEIVPENSIIQENAVKDNKNNQDNVDMVASNDKNNEQMPTTHRMKRLRNTKSKLQGKQVKRSYKAKVELVPNESHLEDIHTDTPLKCVQECEVESTVNNETPLLLPEKHTNETTTENQVAVSEKCTTETSINSETQEIVPKNNIIQENAVKDNINNQDHVDLVASNDKNNEQLPITHSRKRLRSTKSKLQGKQVKYDKEKVKLVNNESHLKDIRTDTTLNCIQECEVKSTVSNKTSLTEKHTDETTTENIENQVAVSEKCTTETSINSETQETVPENSIIQENKCTVVDENSGDKVNLYTSNDTNNEQLPIPHRMKRLRSTKSKLQGKKKGKSGIPASIIYDQELTECYGEMLPPYCEPNCQNICYNAIPGPQRLQIFKAFQLLLSVTEQNCTIAELVQVGKTKKHEYCPTFRLSMGEKLVVVCRSFFINTLGITERRLNLILKPVNYDWYRDKENALRANLPEQVKPVEKPIVVTDFMKESSLLLDKDYDSYISEIEPCVSIDEVSEDEKENVVIYLKTIPRVPSSFDVPGERRKQFFETTINVDFVYKGYSEKYLKNGKSPPCTKKHFVQIYNLYMKTFVHRMEF